MMITPLTRTTTPNDNCENVLPAQQKAAIADERGAREK
tara:strand:+ start:325 stop:438 length:114 start_codon:yes stop_codon:yes gene_type:complete